MKRLESRVLNARGSSWKDRTIKTLQADYLVIGAGAMGMAFVDTMLDQSDATFIIVDRHHMPGGHWNDAYSFVRLHQPSAFYGVASTELGSMNVDRAGSNKGFYELAGGAEILAYFDRLMRDRFLPSGRVQYFPMCEYVGEGTFRSLLSGDEYAAKVRRKSVDTTFFATSVPSTHKRNFEVGDGVNCVAPNDLPRVAAGYDSFVVLGGGKTAMDAAVWLMDNGAEPERITWVVPRDSWMLNRETTQPGAVFFPRTVGGFARQLEAMKDATSVDDLFERLEAASVMLRVDPAVRPEMFHYATISAGEVAQLRRIPNVVREGRVARIEGGQLVMTNGVVVTCARGSLYVDCTASAVQFAGSETVPVFQESRIILQAVRAPLATTSAAIIAFVEARFDDEEKKNHLCRPVAITDTPGGWLPAFLANMRNQDAWAKEPAVRDWLAGCRLNPARPMPGDENHARASVAKTKAQIGATIGPALQNVQQLLRSVDPTSLR